MNVSANKAGYAALISLLAATALAGCSETVRLTLEVDPPSVVLGDGAVALKAVVDSATATDFLWRVVARPEGSASEIADINALETTFTPDLPGEYEFEFAARVGGTRSGGGLASSMGSRSTAIRRMKLEATALRGDAELSTLVITPNRAFANGKAAVQIVVTALDSDEVPVADAQVKLNVSGWGNTLVPATQWTNKEGQASFSLTSGTAGVKTVTASFVGVTLTESVAFISSGANLDLSTLVVEPVSAVADGEDELVATLRLVNTKSEPLADVAVEFSSQDEADVFTTSTSAVTNEDGYATARVTSLKAGRRPIFADFVGERLQTDLIFTSGGIDMEASKLEFSTEEMVAGASETMTITLIDPFGNPVVGKSVRAFGGDEERLFVEVANGVTNSSGRYVFNLNGTGAGSYELGVEWGEDPEDPTGGGALVGELTVVPGPVSLDTSFILAEFATIAVDGEESLIRAVLRDAYYNAIKDLDVAFGATGGGNTLTTVLGATAWDGTAVARLASTEVGVKTVTATFGSPPEQLSTRVSVVEHLPQGTLSKLYAEPAQNLVVSASKTTDVVAELRDAQNRPVAGAIVTFSSQNPADVFSPTVEAITDAQGLARVGIASTLSGARTIEAEYGREAGLSLTLTFAPGPLSFEKSSFVSNSGTLVANGTIDTAAPYAARQTLTLRDEFGNGIAGALVTYSVEEEGVELSRVEGTTSSTGRSWVDVGSSVTGDIVVTASGEHGTPPRAFEMKVSLTFTLDPPRILETTVSGNAFTCEPIVFRLKQTQEQPVSVVFEFQARNGDWKAAAPYREPDRSGGLGEPGPGLWTATRSGVDHRFEWDIAAARNDLGFPETVRFRIRPQIGTLRGTAREIRLNVDAGFDGPHTFSALAMGQSLVSLSPGRPFGRNSGGVTLAVHSPGAVMDCQTDPGTGFGKCTTVPVSGTPVAAGMLARRSADTSVVVLTAEGDVGVLRYNGAGNSSERYAFGGQPTHFATADLVRNGEKADVVVIGTSEGRGKIGLLIRDASGGYTGVDEVATVPEPLVGVVWADVTNDGLDDIVALSESGEAFVFMNEGGGLFSMIGTYSAESEKAHSLTVADLDGDGAPDLVFLDGDHVRVLPGASGAGFNQTLAWSYSLKDTALAVATGDFDDDERLDLVVTQASGDIALLSGDGIFFGPERTLTRIEGAAHSIGGGDLNRDGLFDFATANTSNGSVSVFFSEMENQCRVRL